VGLEDGFEVEPEALDGEHSRDRRADECEVALPFVQLLRRRNRERAGKSHSALVSVRHHGPPTPEFTKLPTASAPRCRAG